MEADGSERFCNSEAVVVCGGPDHCLLSSCQRCFSEEPATLRHSPGAGPARSRVIEPGSCHLIIKYSKFTMPQLHYNRIEVRSARKTQTLNYDGLGKEQSCSRQPSDLQSSRLETQKNYGCHFVVFGSCLQLLQVAFSWATFPFRPRIFRQTSDTGFRSSIARAI